MAEYWDSKGNIHHDIDFGGKSSTSVDTMGKIVKPIVDSSILCGGNVSIGVPIILGKTISTIGNRMSRPGISTIEQYGSDNLIDSILNNKTVFGSWLDNKDKRRLFKDALALSQDVYVINSHSTNFYHTFSYSTLKKGWFLINSKLNIEHFPKFVQCFCNETKGFLHSFNNFKSGLGSMLCISDFINGLYIIAYIFEGTNQDGLQDAGADFEQGFIGKTPQYTQAIWNAKNIVAAFNRHLKNVGKLYFFGHSLGGGLANAAALATGFPAITFNAASLHPDYVSQYENNYKKHLLMGAYVEGEILSTPMSNGVGLPKTGDRYKIRLSWDDYNTDALPIDGKSNPFHYSAVRKHMLEPLCAKYNLEKDSWNKKNEL